MTLNEFQNRAEEFTESYFDSVDHCAIVLGEEAGEVLGKVKKWGRDAGFDRDSPQFKGIKDELGDVLWSVARMSTKCGWTLEEVAQANCRKMADRKARGVLHGEGDNR